MDIYIYLVDGEEIRVKGTDAARSREGVWGLTGVKFELSQIIEGEKEEAASDIDTSDEVVDEVVDEIVDEDFMDDDTASAGVESTDAQKNGELDLEDGFSESLAINEDNPIELDVVKLNSKVKGDNISDTFSEDALSDMLDSDWDTAQMSLDKIAESDKNITVSHNLQDQRRGGGIKNSVLTYTDPYTGEKNSVSLPERSSKEEKTKKLKSFIDEYLSYDSATKFVNKTKEFDEFYEEGGAMHVSTKEVVEEVGSRDTIFEPIDKTETINTGMDGKALGRQTYDFTVQPYEKEINALKAQISKELTTKGISPLSEEELDKKAKDKLYAELTIRKRNDLIDKKSQSFMNDNPDAKGLLNLTQAVMSRDKEKVYEKGLVKQKTNYKEIVRMNYDISTAEEYLNGDIIGGIEVLVNGEIVNLGNLDDGSPILQAESGALITQDQWDTIQQGYANSAALYKEIGIQDNELKNASEKLGDLKIQMNAAGLEYSIAEKSVSTATIGLTSIGAGTLYYGGKILNSGLLMFHDQLLDEQFDKNNEWLNEKGAQFSKFKQDLRNTYVRDISVDEAFDGDISNFGKFVAQEISTQGPILIAMAASGGTLAPYVVGAYTAGEKMMEMAYEDSLTGSTTSELEMFAKGTGFGLANGVFTGLTTNPILQRGIRSFKSPIIGGTDDLATWQLGAKDYFNNTWKRAVVYDPTREFLGEIATNVVENAIDGKPVFENAKHVAVSSVGFSFVFSTLPFIKGMAARQYASTDFKVDFDKRQQKIFELNKSYEGLTDKRKGGGPALRKQLATLQNEQAQKLEALTQRATNGIDTQGAKWFLETYDAVNKSRAEASAIVNDPELSFKAKQEALATLETEFEINKIARDLFLSEEAFGDKFNLLEAVDNERYTSLINEAKRLLEVTDTNKAVKAKASDMFKAEEIRAKNSALKKVNKNYILVETKEEAYDAIDKLNIDDAGKERAKKNIADGGAGVNVKLLGTLETIPIAVVENQVAQSKTGVGEHEISHGGMGEMFKGNPAKMVNMSDQVKSWLQTASPALHLKIMMNVGNYKGRTLRAEEYLANFFEIVGEGRIDLSSKENESFSGLGAYMTQDVVGDAYTFNFTGPKDFAAFAVSLGKGIKNGTVDFGQAAIQAQKIDDADGTVEEDTNTVKKSSPLVTKLENELELLYEEEYSMDPGMYEQQEKNIEDKIKAAKAAEKPSTKKGVTTAKKKQGTTGNERILNDRIDDLVGQKNDDGNYNMTKKEWDEGGLSKAYTAIINGTIIDPLIRKGIVGNDVQGKSIDSFIAEVKDGLTSTLLKFNPEENNSLIGWINKVMRFRKGDAFKKFRKENELGGKSTDIQSGEIGSVRELVADEPYFQEEGELDVNEDLRKITDLLTPEIRVGIAEDLKKWAKNNVIDFDKFRFGDVNAEIVKLDEEGNTVYRDVVVKGVVKKVPVTALDETMEHLFPEVDPSKVVNPKTMYTSSEATASHKSWLKLAGTFLDMLPQGATMERKGKNKSLAKDINLDKSTRLDNSILEAFYEKTENRTTKNNGLQDFTLKSNLRISDVYAAFGMDSAGNRANYNRAKEGTLMASSGRLLGKLIINEVIRTDLNLTFEQQLNIAAGKSDLMYSKELKPGDENHKVVMDTVKELSLLENSDIFTAFGNTFANKSFTLDEVFKYFSNEGAALLGTRAGRIFSYKMLNSLSSNKGLETNLKDAYNAYNTVYKYIRKEFGFVEAISKIKNLKTNTESNRTSSIANITEFLKYFSRPIRTAKIDGITRNDQLFEKIIKESGLTETGLKDLGFTLGTGKTGRKYINIEGESTYGFKDITEVKSELLSDSRTRLSTGNIINNEANRGREWLIDRITTLRDEGKTDEAIGLIALLSTDQRSVIRKLAKVGFIIKPTKIGGKTILEHAVESITTQQELIKFIEQKNGYDVKELNDHFETLIVNLIPTEINEALGKEIGGIERYNKTRVKKLVNKALKEGRYFDIGQDIKDNTAKIFTEINESLPTNIQFSKEVSKEEVLKTVTDLNKALTIANSLDVPTKGISIWDFDDTIGRTESHVFYTMPGEISAYNASPKPFSELGKRTGLIFLATKIKEAEAYAESNGGKVEHITVNESVIADESIVLAKMKEIGLDTSEGLLYEMIDPRFEDFYIGKSNVNKLTAALKASGVKGFRYKDGSQISSKGADNIAIIDKTAISEGKKITPEVFAREGVVLTDLGAKFDFKEFSEVINGTKGPLFEKALARNEKFGNENVFILTARPANSKFAIHEFLKGIGLNIPLENITGIADSDPNAKARWVVGKAAEGYNDFYFADDHIGNVKAVGKALNKLPVKSKTELAVVDVLNVVDVKSIAQKSRVKFSAKLDKEFNDIIENSSGIESFKNYDSVKAGRKGKDKGQWAFFVPPSAEDFVGLLYKTLGKGKVGDSQMIWYQRHLITPYSKAMRNVIKARVAIARQYDGIKKQLDIVPKELKKTFELKDENGKSKKNWFTKEMAVRVYVWNKQGLEIEGLSKVDLPMLIEYVTHNPQLKEFAEQLIKLNTGGKTTAPRKGWEAGTITTDLLENLNSTGRAELLEVWQENADVIFSEKNMNKLQAAYGKNYTAALTDILRRMKSGRNTALGGNPLVERFMGWITAAIGDIMFLNNRSAALQLISTFNFLNFRENNIVAAGKAFANTKQFAKDWNMLFNSDYLVDRRDGLRINVNEADIADMAKEQGIRGLITKLLKWGFTPTQIADSVAIATGGATYYRTMVDKLVKKDGMNKQAAESKAMEMFMEIAETSQQSSAPNMISQQQASSLGRTVLAFANTPTQYARIIKKATLDLKNGRGSWKENVAKIVYYGALQNMLFSYLQQAMFATMFEGWDDEEEEDKYDPNVAKGVKKGDPTQSKTFKMLNSMSDSLLRGIGFAGAITSTLKNTGIKLYQKTYKKNPNYGYTAFYELTKISPPISSKGAKIIAVGNAFEWNSDEMETKGLSLDNPAVMAGANAIAAGTNIPTDRVVKKMINVRDAVSSETKNWMRTPLVMGWAKWQLMSDKDKDKEKAAEKEVAKYVGMDDREIMAKQLKDMKKDEQVDSLESYGLNKDEIKLLKYEKDRVAKIMEFQDKYNDKVPTRETPATVQDRPDKVAKQKATAKSDARNKELKDLKKDQQVDSLKMYGLTSKQIRSLKYEQQRIDKIKYFQDVKSKKKRRADSLK